VAPAQENSSDNVQIFDLDGAGIIYAVTNKKSWNRVYRIAAIMKEDIQPEILARAIADLRERFPTFFVQLDEDFFNYKLRTVNDMNVLTKEDTYPCGHIIAGSGNKPMFRVKYFHNRISLEIFHVVTDGSGTMIFLKNIVARYLELLGCEVEKTDGVFDLNGAPTDSETEDSLNKVSCEELKKTSRSEPYAYKYKQPKKENLFMLTHGFFQVDVIKQITKEKGVTVTEYLTALYTWAFYKNLLPENDKKPIKISVPTDLRRIFGSVTLRSFSLYVNTCIYPGRKKYSFDEILAEVTGQLREGFKKENLAGRVVANTAAQNNKVFRSTPLFLKKLILKIGYVLLGEKTMTTSLTNLGIIKIPKGMDGHLDHFDFVSGGTLVNYLNCAIATCNNMINVIFSSRSEATDVQRTFFTFLAEQGINIEIQSNIKQEAVGSHAMLRCDKCNVEFKDNHLCCPLCGKTGVMSDRMPSFVTAPYPEL